MSPVPLVLPRLYAIMDSERVRSEENHGEVLARFAEELVAGGATLIQYRNKQGSTRDMVSEACAIKVAVGDRARLVMNDRADLCLAAGFDGVHVGQDDLSPAGARRVVGPSRVVGVSTHHPEQIRNADASPTDYIAIGPVFATASKANPGPVIGLEGVAAARALTRKPLVAIGGIQVSNCKAVLEAGADTVAVLAELLDSPGKTVEAFLRLLG
jgi:thiamine-phosphate pyrophosphorylase